MLIDDDSKKPTGPAANTVPGPTASAPPAPVAAPSASLDALLQTMLRREAKQLADEEAKERANDAKLRQRRFNAESNFEDDKARQSKCTHLKGGRNRIRTQAKDFAVSSHRFVNNEQVVRCLLCGAKWKSKDTTEYLYRYGKQIPNHTGIGWREALQMAAESSNKPSSSEIPMNVVPQQTAQAPQSVPSLIEN